jgi:hypothetical protein
MHFDIDRHLIGGKDPGEYAFLASKTGHKLTIRRGEGFDPGADLVAFFQERQSPPIKTKRAVLYETGFFAQAAHLDTRGLWAASSFHTQEAIDRIMAYKAPERAQDVLSRAGLSPSKYVQPSAEARWGGVVLAAQVSLDHSVTTLPGGRAQRDHFWAFIEGACKHYKRQLFIKMHPRLHGYDRVNYTTLAGKYGCRWGDVGLSILDHAKFVLVYNSGFAVDCWLRGVPVAQFEAGYFSDTPAVTFTMGEYPDELDSADTAEAAQRMVDWLAWRYCYYQDMPPGAFISMLEAFARVPEGETFPLPEALSYAAQCLAMKGGVHAASPALR